MPAGFAKALSVCLLQWNDGPGAKPRTQGRGWARGLAPDAAESRARGRGRGPPPPGAGATGPERLFPGGAAGAGLRSARLCPIRQGKARMPTPEMRPRRGQSTGPAVTRTCRRALPGGSRAAAWGPGAGGLAAVSSPHLPEGTGGRCSALIHKCGRGLRGFPGPPRVPGEPPGLASRRHLPASLQGLPLRGPYCHFRKKPRQLSRPHMAESRVGLCTGSHKGAEGRGHQGGASRATVGGRPACLRDPTQALRRAARSPQSPSHSEISLVTSEPGGAIQEASSGHLFSNYWYKNIQGCDL